MNAFQKGFRHKSIAAFRIDGYVADDSEPTGKRKIPIQFKDHQLTITAPSESELEVKVAAFVKAMKGCHPSDQLQIDELQVVDNARSLFDPDEVRSNAVRGAVDTGSIPDSMAPSKAVPTPNQKLGLNVKQA